MADYHQDSDNAWTMCSMSKFVIHIHEAQIHEVHCSNRYEFCSFAFLSSFQGLLWNLYLFQNVFSKGEYGFFFLYLYSYLYCIVVSRCLLSTWCSRSRATIRPERQLFHLAKTTTIIVNSSTIQSKYIVLNVLYPISATIPLAQD